MHYFEQFLAEGCKACWSVLTAFPLMNTLAFSSPVIPGSEKASTKEVCLSLRHCLEWSMIFLPLQKKKKEKKKSQQQICNQHAFDEPLWPVATLLLLKVEVWAALANKKYHCVKDNTCCGQQKNVFGFFPYVVCHKGTKSIQRTRNHTKFNHEQTFPGRDEDATVSVIIKVQVVLVQL